VISQLDDLSEYLYAPLMLFAKDEIKDMRECRRNYERIVERYDNALLRFYALSKTKEASALREVLRYWLALSLIRDDFLGCVSIVRHSQNVH